ncbi:MAG: cellulase family glycosylhydrolase [Microscillaceae bacterium]|nr:cellulase family glycosylhydrolase [Microscillaceae bacterium]
MSKIYLEGAFFKDEAGRRLMLRGVNLSGSAKYPPGQPSHRATGLYGRKFSYVNRPLSLQEAPQHFARLKSWGFTLLRFLVPWEALEPQQPGEYDLAYLEYLQNLLSMAGEYGLQIVIDPHQDVWSRFSGGDGAPRWTFEKVGLNVEKFAAVEAAVLHHTEGGAYEEMIWPTNYTKFAAATMFTLFFGGNHFAPHVQIEGQSAQDYLQSCYLAAYRTLAQHLQSLPNVIGFETMNEPSSGWIGWPDLANNAHIYRRGKSPSPFESMALASGNPLLIEEWKLSARGPRLKKRVEGNPRGVKIWLNGFRCFWKEAGIWEIHADGQPRLLQPHYFAQYQGQSIHFEKDFLWPFIQRYAQTIREVLPQAMIWAGFPPAASNLPLIGEPPMADFVHAAHWYDAATLIRKKFSRFWSWDKDQGKIVWGRKKVRRMFAEQIGKIIKDTETSMGKVPVLIGEVGVPFDMHGKKAYRTGNFSRIEMALDASLQALEAHHLSYTLWNYTPDNSNEYGEGWNGEDLSIFSPDQQTDPSNLLSGARAWRAWLRPYPMCTAGTPLRLLFHYQKPWFEYEFEHQEGVNGPSLIFAPKAIFPTGIKVEISDGNYEMIEEAQILVYYHSIDRYRHIIRLSKP